jgi:hypothetical protein
MPNHRRAETALSVVDPAAVPILERRVEHADLLQIVVPSGNWLIAIVIVIADDKMRMSDPELETGRPTPARFVRRIDVAGLA